MKKEDPLVSIIIPTYNGEKYIKQCLLSLLRQTFKDFELIIVDNNSNDKTVILIHDILKNTNVKYKIIVNKKNLGFTGAINKGLKYSRGKYLVLLNQDTRVEPDWLENLVKAADNDPYAAIFQSKILYPNGLIRTTGNILDIYGMFKCRGQYKANSKIYDKDQYGFFYASGASILVRKQVIEFLGGLDYLLFMYHEDVDLCWQVRLLGFKVKYVPDSICFHYGGEYLSVNHLKFYFISRNRLRVLIKNYSFKKLYRVVIAAFFVIASSILLTIIKRDAFFLYLGFRSIYWNIRHIKNTIKQRKFIQRLRRVNDKEIEKFMYKRPLEIDFWLRNLLKKYKGKSIYE